MKNAFILKGVGGSGKSTTLKLVYTLLCEKYPFAKKELLSRANSRVDICVTMKVGNVLIGLETQGDPGSRVTKSLKKFVEQNCDIIVCAVRSKGKTIENAQEILADYKIQYIEQVEVPTEKISSTNAKTANDIVTSITKLIDDQPMAA